MLVLPINHNQQVADIDGQIEAHYVVTLTGVSIGVSLCVMAMVTLVKKDVEMGLAARSYTIGLAAVLLGLLTMRRSIV